MPRTGAGDRMGCLKATGWAAPRPVSLRTWYCPPRTVSGFATNYGFRPDFCEADDPESKSEGLSANSGRTLERLVAEVVVLSDESFERAKPVGVPGLARFDFNVEVAFEVG